MAVSTRGVLVLKMLIAFTPHGFTPGKASFATLKFHIKEANGSVTDRGSGWCTIMSSKVRSR